ncbi:HD domain-containing protein [Desertibacillus haloalkaliphilus]|uniref:HD domain-containing protein n=1 Tax=Desertibacillus haloalkaliphilus TaxID=1328930 RepID=UPI001C264856|nr:HD domain-containing protein [Desertibacillus haloalkaliphilus]MBU8906921.1 HD domain-containing protein [Desertibacillus haloalkaliphilus]
MRNVTLTQLFQHPIAQKYVKRSGLAHAIAAAYHALHLSKTHQVDPDLATKAAFLHDIGHYTWYRNGKWDFELYKENDIHAIKGAERAHKLLIRLGEEPQDAKQIALAVLLHTDSYLPEGNLQLNPLQTVVALADEADEEPNGNHHYRQISDEKALKQIKQLDRLIDETLAQRPLKKSV